MERVAGLLLGFVRALELAERGVDDMATRETAGTCPKLLRRSV